MSIALNWLDPYRDTGSRVHGMDPRIKLVLALAFILAVTTTPPALWPAYIAFLALVWSSAFMARLSPLRVLRRSLIGIYFSSVVILSVPFVREGATMAHFPLFRWDVTITDQGLMLLLGVIAKSWLSVTAATVLISSTRFAELLQAMTALRIPRIMVAIVGFTYRYLFVLVEEAQRMAVARDSRSAEPDERKGGTILWRARVLGGMLASLLLRSYERSERIFEAMTSRGYSGQVRSLQSLSWRRHEVMAGAAALAALAAVELMAYLWFRGVTP
jgi:cobalt/nickel transport system permease protein